MATKHKTIDSREVRKRAAEIQSHWSPLERAKRMGLPPDVPARMRELILGPASGWKLAVAAQPTANPFRG
jgi:hypothetical protein